MYWTSFKKFGTLSETSSPLPLSQAGYEPDFAQFTMPVGRTKWDNNVFAAFLMMGVYEI